MIQLESAIIANKFSNTNANANSMVMVGEEAGGNESDNEVNKNRLDDISIEVERND